jgi:hypothetical protein
VISRLKDDDFFRDDDDDGDDDDGDDDSGDDDYYQFYYNDDPRHPFFYGEQHAERVAVLCEGFIAASLLEINMLVEADGPSLTAGERMKLRYRLYEIAAEWARMRADEKPAIEWTGGIEDALLEYTRYKERRLCLWNLHSFRELFVDAMMEDGGFLYEFTGLGRWYGEGIRTEEHVATDFFRRHTLFCRFGRAMDQLFSLRDDSDRRTAVLAKCIAMFNNNRCQQFIELVPFVNDLDYIELLSRDERQTDQEPPGWTSAEEQAAAEQPTDSDSRDLIDGPSLARKLGVSSRTITSWRDRGYITAVESGSAGKAYLYDVASVRKEIEAVKKARKIRLEFPPEL